MITENHWKQRVDEYQNRGMVTNECWVKFTYIVQCCLIFYCYLTWIKYWTQCRISLSFVSIWKHDTYVSDTILDYIGWVILSVDVRVWMDITRKYMCDWGNWNGTRRALLKVSLDQWHTRVCLAYLLFLKVSFN